MKIIILMLLTLTVFMTSCGNVDDTDGKIGNEKNETTDGTENIKDKAEDIVDDATDMMDDATDALSIDVKGNFRLTTEQAQSAALSDAGCSGMDVTFYKTYLHNEDDRVYYDVEFATDVMMYEYEIDSVSGKVLKREESVIK